MTILLWAWVACEDADKRSDTRGHDTSEISDTSDTSDETFGLSAEAVALHFVSAGEAVPDGALTLVSTGPGSTGGLSITVAGEFAITGDLGPLAAGETRALTVSYTGPTADPALVTGTATVRVDEVAVDVPLAAVIGDPDLGDGTWIEDSYGQRVVLDLPSAPFPYGSASYDDASVLIFIPWHFSDEGDVGVVTHLHGHNATLEDVVADQYLVEQHALSGRDAILVVPQGPEEAADGDFGRLDTAGGHAALVRDAISVAYRDGRLTRPELRRQVLTAHSGGYLCVSYILQQGGLDVSTVHLFDALYGQADVYAGFAVGRGILRSVYTASGGTDDNNEALAADLEEAGVTVGTSFSDAALYSTDVIVGSSDASHSACTWTGRAYARWLVGSGLRRSPLAPPELDSVRSDGETATVTWRDDRGDDGLKMRIEGSEDGATWALLARSDGRSAEVEARPWIRVRGPDADSQPSDRYAGGGGWLVVDGFDRVLGGSWTAPTHDFAARVGAALGGASTASNEAVASGAVSLSDFPGVVWLLGDESSADDTFDAAEMSAIDAYVSGGGPLIVSGAELGYATDAGWLEATLHAAYVSDDAGTTQASGYEFGVQYEEDYPDVLSGDTTLWSYATAGAAAVGHDHQIVAVGFGLENLGDEDLAAAMAELREWVE